MGTVIARLEGETHPIITALQTEVAETLVLDALVVVEQAHSLPPRTAN